MTFQTTVTKSPTLELSDDQRNQLIDLIAERYLENMDSRDLVKFFLDNQRECLNEYSDKELLGAAEDVTYCDEYEDIIRELS